MLLKSHRSFRSTGFHLLSCGQNDPNEVNRAKLKLSYCAMFFYSQKLSKYNFNFSTVLFFGFSITNNSLSSLNTFTFKCDWSVCSKLSQNSLSSVSAFPFKGGIKLNCNSMCPSWNFFISGSPSLSNPWILIIL